MADNSSSSVASVAIVVIVILAVALFYFVFVNSRDDDVNIELPDVNIQGLNAPGEGAQRMVQTPNGSSRADNILGEMLT